MDTLRIVKTNAPEWPFLLMGGLGSIVMGASMPIYAFLFAEVLGLLSDPVDTARTEIIFYSLMFLLLGVAVGLAMLIQIAMFTVAGENLTLRMRKLAFAAMLKQEMGWFDQPNNNTGALCSRLSADASAIQGVKISYILNTLGQELHFDENLHKLLIRIFALKLRCSKE